MLVSAEETRNRHYGKIMREYVKLLRTENILPEDLPEFGKRGDNYYMYNISKCDDTAFCRFVNVAGNSVREGKIAGLDGIYIGPDGCLSKDPLACRYQKQLSDF